MSKEITKKELFEKIEQLEKELTGKSGELEKLKQMLTAKDELIDKWRRDYHDEAIKLQDTEQKMNEINQNHIICRMAQIKMFKHLLHYNGDDDNTHRNKAFHTARAIKILDYDYKELLRIQKEKLSYYSNINEMPF